ncbi:MAG: class I SAM-dependent methyltransferase [Candidatus Omnitrophica bacterium]|nr:class I SAM-dependent methyltransferase [Candidatus Omnitrophota bacterium]
MARSQIEEYYNCSVAACDLNKHALENMPKGRGNLYFYNIHQRNAEFREYFQTVLLLDVLEHIKDPVSFLKSVNFHMKSGGKVIINLPAFNFMYSRYDRVAGHIKRYTIAGLRKELELAGFKLERAVYWGASLVPFLLARKYIMLFCKGNARTIKCGFQPVFPFVNDIFLAIMRFENTVISHPFIGSSLLAVARKT